MSYTVTIEVSGQPDKPGGFYTAVAIIGGVTSPDGWVRRPWRSELQHSYSRERAISYALTEAALAFSKGEIKP